MVVFTAAPTQRGTQQRWFGVAVLGLNAIDQMFFLAGYPFWSLTIIAADDHRRGHRRDLGLCAYGSRENIEAAA